MPQDIKSVRHYKHITPQIGTTNLSRRKFLGSVVIGGTALAIPSKTFFAQNINTDILSSNHLRIVTSIQKILFPSDGNGPGAWEVNADKYLLWVLSDKRIDPDESEYIIKGIGWIDETAEEEYSTGYNNLSNQQQVELVNTVSKENWGKSWLGVILNFIFEALLSDPQYGGNPEEIGWKWLNHNPGFPRPTAPLLYPTIVKTVEENTTGDE